MGWIVTAIFIGSSSNLQVTRACIKSWRSSNSGLIGMFALQLLAFVGYEKPVFVLLLSLASLISIELTS